MLVNPGFREKKLTKEKWGENYYIYRQNWNDWPQTGHVGRYPLHIDLEVTSRCNLRCPFCTREFMRRQDIGDMSLATAVDVLEECAHKVPSIKFNWRGEPTLYRELPFLVRAAKRRGFIETAINTNGTKLDLELIAALASAELDRIIISIDSHIKESYEKERVGAIYEEVMENIRTLLHFKRDMGLDRPYVRVQKVNVPHLSQENDAFMAFFTAMGVDSVAINSFKQKDVALVEWSPLQCSQVFQRMMVTWDGKYLPCCQGNNFERPIGRVGDMTMQQAWNSDYMNKLRSMHLANEQVGIPACKVCEVTRPEG